MDRRNWYPKQERTSTRYSWQARPITWVPEGANPSSPRIGDILEQTLYAHKNGIAVEIVLNSSCLGGRQLIPAEKHAARDEYSQTSKQMRCRQFRADAIQAAGRGCGDKYCRWYVETVGLGITDGGKIEEIAEGYANLSSRRGTICQIVWK